MEETLDPDKFLTFCNFIANYKPDYIFNSFLYSNDTEKINKLVELGISDSDIDDIDGMEDEDKTDFVQGLIDENVLIKREEPKEPKEPEEPEEHEERNTTTGNYKPTTGGGRRISGRSRISHSNTHRNTRHQRRPKRSKRRSSTKHTKTSKRSKKRRSSTKRSKRSKRSKRTRRR